MTRVDKETGHRELSSCPQDSFFRNDTTRRSRSGDSLSCIRTRRPTMFFRRIFSSTRTSSAMLSSRYVHTRST
ncbi:hypothetical protein E2C01_039117 [Portunus trituberculatus]|uniref:Uncharacterized protein n=1 Tax=Portunus trituberculatus TaxID=210409 RepID=A0A5B7FJT1_PORTR|nr:hypothetical protein [Portunus trituberculatus]